MRKGFLLIFFALFCGFSPIIFAQKKQINTASSPTNAELRFSKNREILQKKSFIGGLTFENIGPVVMSGRVTDIEVNPDNHKEFFVAYASGGLWYTDDCGQTFKPLFQNEKVITIGDIAVDWAAGTIWVGTGENNSSRSSYAGNGVYKSEDKGATWIYCGLPDSQHISRIILHPTEKNTLWVAVLGHLYSENDERGVFKSLDGGRTWKKVLYISPKVGV
jgi:hypothetical protein